MDLLPKDKNLWWLWQRTLSYYFSFPLQRNNSILAHIYLQQWQFAQALEFPHIVNAGVLNAIISGVAMSHSMFLLGLLFKNTDAYFNHGMLFIWKLYLLGTSFLRWLFTSLNVWYFLFNLISCGISFSDFGKSQPFLSGPERIWLLFVWGDASASPVLWYWGWQQKQDYLLSYSLHPSQ